MCKYPGTITGDILWNGRPTTVKVRKNTAYVMQDNIHYGALTVRESILFAAEFRLPESLSREEKEARGMVILKSLGIDKVADTLVGDAFTRGISGGQLKRLSIAVEIVALPSIIFLDGKQS
jgi:ABC-type multidrug transport system ATPase subunit